MLASFSTTLVLFGTNIRWITNNVLIFFTDICVSPEDDHILFRKM